MPNLLVVDDDHAFRRMLCRTLSELGFETTEAHDGLDAVEKLEARQYELVITDLDMPRADGFALIDAVHQRFRGTPVVMVTASTRTDCVSALRAGATDFLMKPCHPSELERVVRSALVGRDASRASNRPQAALLGESSSMRKLLDDIERVAALDAPVRFDAESGNGSDAFARLLHGLSKRGAHAFVSVAAHACTDDALLDAARHAGRGTLYVDDVTALPLATQATLAKIIERQTRDGDGARVVARTQHSLEEWAAERRFDEQLSLLLHEARITLPPLRDRPEDVPILLRHFLDDANRRLGREVNLQEKTTEALLSYRFPGNVGELEEMVEHLVRRAPRPGEETVVEEAELAVHFVDATLLMHDGKRRDVAVLTSGGQTVTSLVHGGEAFFVTDEGGVVRHFAGSAIAMVSVAQRIDADDELPRHVRKVRVTFLSGATADGDLRWVRGAARRSVCEVLCDPPKLFVLHDGATTSFVSKSHVAWVEEIS